MYKILFFAPLLFCFQSIDEQLTSQWKLIWDDGHPVEEVLEVSFKADHTFEREKQGKTATGTWKVISGKENAIIELFFQEKKEKVFFEIRFSGDSLFLQNDSEKSVFLRIE